MKSEQHEASCKLLMAEHALKHAQNNASAFAFMQQIATTPQKRLDAASCEGYWREQVAINARTVKELELIANLQHK